MAVKLYNPVSGRDVYFDDCRRTDGAMVDAKGFVYARLIEEGRKYDGLKAGVDAYLTGQALRQFQAAQGRPIEWCFAEKKAADYVRKIFKGDHRLSTRTAQWWRKWAAWVEMDTHHGAPI